MISTIKTDFDKVLAYSQNIKANLNTTPILEAWQRAKSRFIKHWGGQCIKECGEVAFELSEEEKLKRLCEFIDVIEHNYQQYELAYFLAKLPATDFFANKLSEDYLSREGIKVQKNIKIIKAFKYFVQDEELLDKLQTQASMIIQENKVSGILCLSVHPLDFLSLSENNHNWRSCHALDGDYRAGNLSYMMDKSTIICYLRHDGAKSKLPNFPEDVLWHSKKWRMLLFEEDFGDALFAGRQYPFFSPNALTVVKENYLNSVGKKYEVWSDWHKDYIINFPREKSCNYNDKELHNRFVALDRYVYNMDELVVDADGSQHYNDLKYSTCYIPYYCWSHYPKNPRHYGKMHFTIGADTPCICCGASIDMESSMLCTECEEKHGEGENDYFAYCDCCDRRLPRSQLHYLSGNGARVCDHCYEEYTEQCAVCGDTYYNCELTYDESHHEWRCAYCRESNAEKRAFRPVIVFDDEDLPF